MRRAVYLLSLALAGSQPLAAAAQEANFLQSLAGNWQGAGQVLMRIGSDPVNVRCSFATTAGRANFSMNGNCRGFVVVRRAVSANLRVSGGRYTGTYVGPMGLPSALSGSRRGNAINLSVRWARPVNGDRNATMTIEKVGADGLRLRTVDRDHATGGSVVTSNIDLMRQ